MNAIIRAGASTIIKKGGKYALAGLAGYEINQIVNGKDELEKQQQTTEKIVVTPSNSIYEQTFWAFVAVIIFLVAGIIIYLTVKQRKLKQQTITTTPREASVGYT